MPTGDGSTPTKTSERPHHLGVPSLNPFQKPLILIGYWSGGYADGGWPDVRDFVDQDWDEDERVDVGIYLRNGLVARAWLGFSRCRLCDNAANGNLDLTDGIYIWPEGLAHYVFDHHVRLPPEFVEHVQARNELADDVHVDERWWRSVAPPAG
ncbi:hypothetical protein OG558_25740 [Kribbella sp. NBC_01510]|uniref:hypothetical protein n=1 Tax=Kribbella sp. NBC_01510 TaxID=2903581 RepID=UPI00386E98F6